MTIEQAKMLKVGDYVKVLPNMISIMDDKYNDYYTDMDIFINKVVKIRNIWKYKENHLSFTLEYGKHIYYFTEECLIPTSANILYAPKNKQILENLNIEDNKYFKKYNTLVIGIDPNFDKEPVKKLILKLCDYIPYTDFIRKYIDNFTQNLYDMKRYCVIYAHYTKDYSILTWDDFNIFDENEYTFSKIYNFSNENDLRDIDNILKWGIDKPEYLPKKHNIIQEKISNLYFSKYNSVFVKIPINIDKELAYKNITKLKSKYGFSILDSTIRFILTKIKERQKDAYIFVVYRNPLDNYMETIDDGWNYLEDYNTHLRLNNRIKNKDIFNLENIDDLLNVYKWGVIKPDYSPKYRKLDENLNNRYFNKYNTIIIKIDKSTNIDIFVNNMLKLKPYGFSYYDSTLISIFTRVINDDINAYFYLKYIDNIDNFLNSIDGNGWNYMSSLANHTESENLKYDKVYNSKDIDNILNIYKYGYDIPNYNPKYRKLDENVSIANNRYFNKYNTIIIKITPDIDIDTLIINFYKIKKYGFNIAFSEQAIKNIYTHNKIDNTSWYLFITYNNTPFLSLDDIKDYGWNPLNDLDAHVRNRPSMSYNSIYDIRDITRIENIYKYGCDIPDYKPKYRKLDENLNIDLIEKFKLQENSEFKRVTLRFKDNIIVSAIALNNMFKIVYPTDFYHLYIKYDDILMNDILDINLTDIKKDDKVYVNYNYINKLVKYFGAEDFEDTIYKNVIGYVNKVNYTDINDTCFIQISMTINNKTNYHWFNDIELIKLDSTLYKPRKKDNDEN